MSETLPSSFSWMLAALAGLLLGAIFFGGLWWTVRRGLASRRPALWFFASLVLRMAIAMAGIYWVGREIGPWTWQTLLSCLLGFVLARPLVLRLTASTTEARHAT